MGFIAFQGTGLCCAGRRDDVGFHIMSIVQLAAQQYVQKWSRTRGDERDVQFRLGIYLFLPSKVCGLNSPSIGGGEQLQTKAWEYSYSRRIRGQKEVDLSPNINNKDGYECESA
jgi:hypothetical protein